MHKIHSQAFAQHISQSTPDSLFHIRNHIHAVAGECIGRGLATTSEFSGKHFAKWGGAISWILLCGVFDSPRTPMRALNLLVWEWSLCT